MTKLRLVRDASAARSAGCAVARLVARRIGRMRGVEEPVAYGMVLIGWDGLVSVSWEGRSHLEIEGAVTHLLRELQRDVDGGSGEG